MQRKFLLATAILLLGFGNMAMAQYSAADSRLFFDKEELPVVDHENWSVYADEENRIYYIDFETLNVNLSDIVVKNEKGEIVWKDDVFELPVNTIYELDFSQYSSGKYEIELRSFTGVIRKTISIK